AENLQRGRRAENENHDVFCSSFGRLASPRVWKFRYQGQAARAFSTGKLNASRRVHPRPIAWWSARALERPCGLGDLIWGGASCLDAFSAYPVRTWLPGGATGVTTGSPEVRPPRSSRTRGGFPQISCARDG